MTKHTICIDIDCDINHCGKCCLLTDDPREGHYCEAFKTSRRIEYSSDTKTNMTHRCMKCVLNERL